MEPRDLSRGVAQHCWLLLTRAGFPYKNSWGLEMASGETCQTCSTGCWRVCSPLTWGTPHLQHLLMLRIHSSYWSKFPLRSPCSQCCRIWAIYSPWGCPQGTVVQMWPWEGGESTGYPMRCRAGRHVWNLQACLYLRFKQQHHIASASSAQGRQAAGFYKGLGFDSSPEPHANVNSREPAPGPRNPETLSGW